MKEVPFYPNDAGDMRCMVAVVRSILEYFSAKKYNWKQVEELTGFKNNIAAWTVKAWTTLAKDGYDIRMIENFDYERYAREGEAYLAAHFRPEELSWLHEHSNLSKLKPQIPAFLSSVHHDVRSPQIADIDQLLSRGYLVFMTLNARALNGKPGYVSHAILVFGKDGNDYIAHDPGLPPYPNRRISAASLWEALSGADNNDEVTGVRRHNAA